MTRIEAQESVIAKELPVDSSLVAGVFDRHCTGSQTSEFRVRVASSPQDLNAIGRLRYRIYVEEMGKSYPAADHDRQLLLDEYDLSSTNLLVEHRGADGKPGELVAAVRETLACAGSSELQRAMNCPPSLLEVIPPSRLSYTTRLVVSRKFRAHPGVLLPMLLEIYQIGAVRGDWVNWIHARTRLAPMFERLGFRRFGEAFWFDPGQCRHQGFVLLMDDIETFARLNSAFCQPCRTHFPAGARRETFEAMEKLRRCLHVGGAS
jgi:N-acyl-L-homoserine lactone synthetase